MTRVKTFLLWLLMVAVPSAFAVCLLVLFPPLLESRTLIILSYCLGVFFLLMVVFVTVSFMIAPPRHQRDEAADYEI